MLKGTYLDQYVNNKTSAKNLVFIYLVSGNQQELEEFDIAQGSHLKFQEGTGKRMFYTTQGGAPHVDLTIGNDGNVYIDKSEDKRQAAEAEAAGVGKEYRELKAQQILAGLTKPASAMRAVKADSIAEEPSAEE